MTCPILQATLLMIVFSVLALESPALGDHVAPGFEQLAKWGPNAKLVGLFDSSRTISKLKLLPVDVRTSLLAGCSLDKPVELRVTQRFRKGAHLERGFHLAAILNVRGLDGMTSIVNRVKTSLLEAMQLERGQEGQHAEDVYVRKLIDDATSMRFGTPAASLKEAGSHQLVMIDVIKDTLLCRLLRVHGEKGWHAVAELELRSVALKASAANAEKVHACSYPTRFLCSSRRAGSRDS